MIRSNVNVITMNANSATALNGVINEAKRAKIPVVSFDQRVTDPYAVNVTVDHYTWGQRYATVQDPDGTSLDLFAWA